MKLLLLTLILTSILANDAIIELSLVGRVMSPVTFVYLKITIESTHLKEKFNKEEELIRKTFLKMKSSSSIWNKVKSLEPIYLKLKQRKEKLLPLNEKRDILGWSLGGAALGLAIYDYEQIQQVRTRNIHMATLIH